MEYTTQMDAARKGIITKEMECVAAKEHMDINELVKLVACGQVIIPANKNHKCLDPNGIGSMLRTKLTSILELQETALTLIWNLIR